MPASSKVKRLLWFKKKPARPDTSGPFGVVHKVPAPLKQTQVHTIPWNEDGSYKVTKKGGVKYMGKATEYSS